MNNESNAQVFPDADIVVPAAELSGNLLSTRIREWLSKRDIPRSISHFDPF
jgi:hypothetical protein